MNTKIIGLLLFLSGSLTGYLVTHNTEGNTRFTAGQLDACQKFTAQLPIPFNCALEKGQVVVTTPLAPGMKVDLTGQPVQ